MTVHRHNTNHISVSVAVRRTGLSPRTVQECLARGLVGEPLTDADLLVLRRVRRLQALGVNMPAIEIILHMRRRIQALQAELTHSERLTAPPMVVYDRYQWRRLLTWDSEGE